VDTLVATLYYTWKIPDETGGSYFENVLAASMSFNWSIRRENEVQLYVVALFEMFSLISRRFLVDGSNSNSP